MCSACSLGKSKKHTHKSKSEDFIQEKLYLLHMDLCGPMRIKSINRKKYILVIVDDYSRFTWVKFLRSKDETLKFVIKFLKMIQVRLNTTVRNIRTNNGTEFVNQTPKSYYEDVGISHQTSVAQAVAIACYTQNWSLIRKRHNKTPYELLHDRKCDLKYLHVFGTLCYPTNDSEDLGKLKPKADIGIFIGYASAKKAYRIYNRRTRKIMETIHVDFDELTTKAYEQRSSGPALHEMTPRTISSGLYFNPPPSVVSPVPAVAAPRPTDLTGTPLSTFVEQDAPAASTSSTTHETQSPITFEGIEGQLQQAPFDDDPFLNIPTSKSSSYESSSIVQPTNPPVDHISK
ncbi:retrovirus-related pol polyprotein from transposon TNT 1-94 [Tanacetum coccineum]